MILLGMVAGASAQPTSIPLVNSDFDSTNAVGWTGNYVEIAANPGEITPNTSSNVLDLLNFPSGGSQDQPDFVLQDTFHQIVAGDFYTLTYYAGVRDNIGNANAVNAVASLRVAGGTSDLASLTVDGASAPLGSMQEYILTWQVPDSGPFLGQDLEVYFTSTTSVPDTTYWHQISLDSVFLTVETVPEPPLLALAGLGGLGLLLFRRWKCAPDRSVRS
jgi:hypothetical protein